MIYLLITGVIIFVSTLIIIIYCRFVYSAMLDDIEHYDLQENSQTD